jgi:hypothetical protein
MILRTVEVNIAGGFFPTGGYVSKDNQKQILQEFAPEINIEKFISENPMLKTGKSGCLSVLMVISIIFVLTIAYLKFIF